MHGLEETKREDNEVGRHITLLEEKALSSFLIRMGWDGRELLVAMMQCIIRSIPRREPKQINLILISSHGHHHRGTGSIFFVILPLFPEADEVLQQYVRQLQPAEHLLRQRQPAAGAGDGVLPGDGARQDQDQAVRRRRDLRAAAGERARLRRVPGAAHLPAGQREPHGAPHHDRRLQEGLR
jgi:hypothetical protein